MSDKLIEFPKPTESAKAVEEYYELLRADESKELAQAIFDELMDMKVNHFHVVWVKEVFQRHGITQNTK